MTVTPRLRKLATALSKEVSGHIRAGRVDSEQVMELIRFILLHQIVESDGVLLDPPPKISASLFAEWYWIIADAHGLEPFSIVGFEEIFTEYHWQGDEDFDADAAKAIVAKHERRVYKELTGNDYEEG